MLEFDFRVLFPVNILKLIREILIKTSPFHDMALKMIKQGRDNILDMVQQPLNFLLILVSKWKMLTKADHRLAKVL